MTDLIVFSVAGNKYALKIDNILRIIESIELTDIPNSHPSIDGMMSYEDGILKVVNFRKLIGLNSYDFELVELFSKLQIAHKVWLDELTHAVENRLSFTKTTDSHKCELGIWLDNFNSYDDKISVIYKNLTKAHKFLHGRAKDVLIANRTDNKYAMEILKTDIYSAFHTTMENLDVFINEIDSIVNSLQKFLIYEKDGKTFAIKVDTIEDIAHICEKDIVVSDEKNMINEFLELDGVLDLDGVLINIIKTVNLPK